MGTETKFVFCSEAWVSVAHQFLNESSRGVDLSGINYTFNEVFTRAPANLAPDEQGRVGWYMRIADGRVEARRGILADADAVIEADYDEILPLARTVFADNPAGAEQAGQTIRRLTESGKFVQRSRGKAPPDMPWAGGLHDVLARNTL